MANLAFYRRELGIATVDGLCDALCASMLRTNRGYHFWVDWEKVNRRTDAYRYQLGLLSTLRGSTDPRRGLAKLLRKYPEVAEAFPRLVAEQSDQLTVLVAATPPFDFVDLDFTNHQRTPQDIEALVTFADKTGLLVLLSRLADPQDYLLGVEVGLDSNARKNRSGVVLEGLIESTIDALVAKYSTLRSMKQSTFADAAAAFGVRYPPLMADSRFDFAVLSRNVPTNVEVNFYGGTGSKPSEIVNAYSDRAHALRQYGWRLVWVTDGPGWLKMRNPLRKGVTDIDYVLNLQMASDGLLERILLEH